jgi:invasion protein IalB
MLTYTHLVQTIPFISSSLGILMRVLIALSYFFISMMNAHAAEGDITLLGSPWFQKCPAKNEQAQKNCVIERTIYLANESKTKLATINIEVLKGAQEALIRFMVPLETLLPLGLTFEIPEKNTLKGLYLFCDVNGCYSQIKIDKDGLQNLMTSKTFVITYGHLKSANNNKEVKLVVDVGDMNIRIKELLC